MTDDTRPEGEGGEGEVGSLADEAARLFAAAADWARQQAGDSGTGSRPSTPRLGDWLGQEHIATGAPECRWCPICQAISLLRTSPDVKEHVASLVVVARQLLDSVADAVVDDGPGGKKPRPESKPNVEHIDLSEDDPWD